jgi:DnaJ-class molecular chaperone
MTMSDKMKVTVKKYKDRYKRMRQSTKIVEVDFCENCGGSGEPLAYQRDDVYRCPNCNGFGYIEVSQEESEARDEFGV